MQLISFLDSMLGSPLGCRVRRQLGRDHLVGTLKEVRQVVEDLRILRRHEGDREALQTRSARSPDAVRIVLF